MSTHSRISSSHSLALFDQISDVSSGEWVTMRQAAQALAQASQDLHSSGSGLPCNVTFSSTPAAPRTRLSASLDGSLHRHWRAEISLPDGCRSAHAPSCLFVCCWCCLFVFMSVCNAFISRDGLAMEIMCQHLLTYSSFAIA